MAILGVAVSRGDYPIVSDHEHQLPAMGFQCTKYPKEFDAVSEFVLDSCAIKIEEQPALKFVDRSHVLLSRVAETNFTLVEAIVDLAKMFIRHASITQGKIDLLSAPGL